jgi:putative sigma-54 modulation protein
MSGYSLALTDYEGDRDPGEVVPGEPLEPDVAERVRDQRRRRAGVGGGVARDVRCPEQQLVPDDAVALVGDRLADDGDLGTAVEGPVGAMFSLSARAARRLSLSAIHKCPPDPYHRGADRPSRQRGLPMRIEVKGRNLQVSDDLREQVTRRFAKIDKQVSDLAVLQVELTVKRDGEMPEAQVAEATLYLKGVTLRARDASRDMGHALHLVSDELTRQVKRHRDKRRNRREGRSAVPAPLVAPDVPGGELPAV